MNTILEINNTRQLKKLLVSNDAENYDIKLILDTSKVVNVKVLEKRLNRYKSSCGCEIGAIFFYLTLTLLIFWSFVIDKINLHSLNTIYFVIKISILIGASILGKIIGILSYKYMFRNTIKKILTYLE